mmetsp:Transcript_30529/g.79257  ORF Transcript_30529/g.79257 Transcript_30529/m.79257 type:complete len:148 (+) Transcript_30529:626-1069(+)
MQPYASGFLSLAQMPPSDQPMLSVSTMHSVSFPPPLHLRGRPSRSCGRHAGAHSRSHEDSPRYCSPPHSSSLRSSYVHDWCPYAPRPSEQKLFHPSPRDPRAIDRPAVAGNARSLESIVFFVVILVRQFALPWPMHECKCTGLCCSA